MISLEITDGGCQNLENMQKRVWAIANEHGPQSEAYLKAQLSFQQALMQILRFGGKLFAEDDLSLIVNSYITLGVIFHPVRVRQEDGSYITDPLLGEWSVHS